MEKVANKNSFYNNIFSEAYAKFECRGTDNTVSNNTFDGSYDCLTNSGSRQTYIGNYFMNIGRNAFVNYADYTLIADNFFYNCTGVGLNLASGGDWINCSGNTFHTIGGTGNNGYGLLVSADYSNVYGNKFMGNMDAAPVYFGSGVHDVNFYGNEMTSVSGNESLIAYGGAVTNVQIYGNMPSTIENKLLGNTTFYDKLTVNGTCYTQVSYAHGYVDIDTDTTVTTTGTTSQFTIFNPTWAAEVTASGFTISGATATYTGKGGSPKKFIIMGGFDMASDTNATTAYVSVFKNGVIYTPSIRKDYLNASSGLYGELALTTLIELSAGDMIDIRFSSDQAATLTISGCEFVITQVN